MSRFKATRRRGDLDEAIVHLRQALELLPPNHPDRSIGLNNLAGALLVRCEEIGDRADADEAVSNGRLALELTPERHPDRFKSCSSLAQTLLLRFELNKDNVDLDECIHNYRRAVELVPDDYSDRREMFKNLSRALLLRVERNRRLVDREAGFLNYKRMPQLPAEGPAPSLPPATGRSQSESSFKPETTPPTSAEDSDIPAEHIYPLQLTLEELFKGGKYNFRITTHLLNGDPKISEVEIDVLPGWKMGTRITFPNAGNEFKPGVFQTMIFVVEQIHHERFARLSKGRLVLNQDISLADSFKEGPRKEPIRILGLDGKTLEFTPPSGVIKPGQETIIRNQGMYIRNKSEVVGRGDLIIRYVSSCYLGSSNNLPTPPLSLSGGTFACRKLLGGGQEAGLFKPKRQYRTPLIPFPSYFQPYKLSYLYYHHDLQVFLFTTFVLIACRDQLRYLHRRAIINIWICP